MQCGPKLMHLSSIGSLSGTERKGPRDQTFKWKLIVILRNFNSRTSPDCQKCAGHFWELTSFVWDVIIETERPPKKKKKKEKVSDNSSRILHSHRPRAVYEGAAVPYEQLKHMTRDNRTFWTVEKGDDCHFDHSGCISFP